MSDRLNKFFVGSQGDGLRILNPPRGIISHDDAIELAAWLVLLAGDFDGEKFMAVLEDLKK
ncbi:MAG: hypothetical protein ABSH36_11865 [Solirubrobacteraceae bacterium]|jgi:hypothetical protein